MQGRFQKNIFLSVFVTREGLCPIFFRDSSILWHTSIMYLYDVDGTFDSNWLDSLGAVDCSCFEKVSKIV